MTDIIIIGAGGFGAEVAWTLARINAVRPVWNLLGFADDAPEKAAGTFAGHPRLGAVAAALESHPQAALAVAVGCNAVRERIVCAHADRAFPVLVDPSADVAPSACLGAGAYVGPQAVVSVNAALGRGVLVNARAGVGHDCTLGDFAQVSPGATLSGFTALGPRAFLGSNACTVPGVTVGADARVAAGMPVYAPVADGVTLSPFGAFKGTL